MGERVSPVGWSTGWPQRFPPYAGGIQPEPCMVVPLTEAEAAVEAERREKDEARSLADCLADQEWPWEWQIATRERKLRKESDDRAEKAERSLGRVKAELDALVKANDKARFSSFVGDHRDLWTRIESARALLQEEGGGE